MTCRPNRGSNRYAAYSDLTVLRDNTIGVLWERGEDRGYEFITFSRFNLQYLEQQDARALSSRR